MKCALWQHNWNVLEKWKWTELLPPDWSFLIVPLIPLCQGAGHGQCHCDLHGLHLGLCHVKDFCWPYRRHPCQVLESLRSFHRNVFGRSDYSPPWQWDLLAVWSGVPGGNDLHHLLCPGDKGEDDRGDPADVFLKFGGEKPRTWFTQSLILF